MGKYSFTNIKLWLKQLCIRLIRRQYPNKKIEKLKFAKKNKKLLNLISSTEKKYLSPYLFNNWQKLINSKFVNVNIFSHSEINDFMFTNFGNHPIYKIYLNAVIPVMKIDIFRICYCYVNGCIWIDIKANIEWQNFFKILNSHIKNKNGLLIYQDRFLNIEIKNDTQKKPVILNGFFYLPKKSFFIKQIIKNIIEESKHFYNINFSNPKFAILDLTGPHQFTKTFYKLSQKKRPILINEKKIRFLWAMPYGRHFSVFRVSYYYGQLRNQFILKSDFYSQLK